MNKKTVLLGNDLLIKEKLSEMGYKVLTCENNPSVNKEVQNHLDIVSFVFPDGTVLLEKRQKKLYEKLVASGYKAMLSNIEIKGGYPYEVAFNCVAFGKTLICSKYTDEIITSKFESVIKVKQGYVKCSICPISENAFITDDESIFHLCKGNFDVLLIEKGDIELKGKKYGFIGGGTMKAENEIFFFGNIDTHRNKSEIIKFLTKHNKGFKCLKDGKITDIGSGYLITQN